MQAAEDRGERSSAEIRAEIEHRLGGFPPLFEPALAAPAVLQDLWRTVSAGLDNPLPAMFKAQLSAYLARLCRSPYLLVSHGCALRSLDVPGPAILELLTRWCTDDEVSAAIDLVTDIDHAVNGWPPLGGPLDHALFVCAVALFRQSPYDARARAALRRALGPERYAHLTALLCQIRHCHDWAEQYPDLDPAADPGVRAQLRGLLDEAPALAELFADYRARVARENPITERILELEQVIESSPYSIAMFDRRMRYLFASTRWISDYRLDLTNEQLRGRCHYDVFPELPDRWKLVHQRSLNGEVVRSDAEEFPRIDGTTNWVRWEVRPYRDETGAVSGIIIFTEDVTAKKRAEAEHRRAEAEHRRAEASLRESEERFRGTFDNAAVGIAHVGLDGRWLRVNDKLCQITGYARDALLELTFQDITHVEDLETDLAYVQAMIAGSISTYSMEKRYIRCNGTIVWINLTVSLTRSPSGEPAYFISIVEDITLQREAERTRERARLFELSLDPVCIVTLDGCFVQANPAFSSVLGHANADLIGRSIAELAHPDDGGAIAEGLDQLARGSASTQFTTRYRCKEGRYRWLQWRLVPSGDGVIYAVARDVTAERELMESMQTNQERYRLLTDGVKDYALFLLDDVGRVLTWNTGAERLKGYRTDEIIGADFSIFFMPEDRASSQPAELLQRARRDGSYEIEGWRVRKDGSRFWANVVVAALRDAGGELRGFAKITRDFTAHHRAVQALHEKQASLAASLKEREVLLQEVHHRVKNNLQVISSLINMQARQLRDSVALEALGECKARVEAIALIHEKLYQTSDYASVPFGDYARGLVTSVFRTSRAGIGTVALVLDIDHGIALPVGRAIPCGLILNELISNAMKHAFPSGKHGSVRVSLRRQDSQLLLTVADDGVGMPADLDVHTSKSLGMHLVTMLVRQLKGQLEISRGVGTSFRISCMLEAPPRAHVNGHGGVAR